MIYRNILFDMGNVIMDFSPDYIISKYTKDVKLINLLKHHIFLNNIWNRADEGLANDDDVYHQAILNLDVKYHKLVKEIIDTWYIHKIQNKEMYNLMLKLKEKGYKLYLCSNAAKSFHLYKDGIKAFELMDAEIISADIKKVKPDKAFFEYVLKTYDLKADQCLFIDDLNTNIRGAYECGIDGYCFNGNVALLEEYMKNVGII